MRASAVPGESPKSIVRFGVFEVDLQARELRKSGMKIKIQEQPFQILVLLLERHQAVLSREELRTRLWPNGTFVDFEHGLNAAVKRLRDALDDDADNPRFIETVPRRGYKFIAPINGATVEATAASIRRSALLSRYWVLIVAVVIVIVVVVLWRLRFNPSELTERQITTNPSQNPVRAAVVSKDGKYVAYVDSTGVYAKLIRTGETHPLRVPPGTQVRPNSWLPDGTHLIATVETTGTLKPALWILSLLGDPPRELIADGASAAVSPDGQRIAFLRGVPSSALVSVSVVPWGFGREIWTMRPDGTEQDLLVPAKDDWVGSITWSPASTQIAYLRIDIGQPNSVRVVTLREHQTREVLSSTALREAIHWSEDGRLFYVLAEDSPNFRDANVWAASLRGAGEISGRSERLTRGHGGIISISGSLDGTVLTFVRSIRDFNIHLDSLLPDGRSTKEKRLALDDSSAVPFSWMADSKSLVFVSRRNGTWDIFKQEIDKPLAEGIVVTSDRWEWIPRLVSYSGEILYTSVADPSPRAPVSLFAVPASGGVSRFILTDEHIDNHQCALPTSPVCVYSKTTAKKESFYKFNLKTGETSDLLVIHSGMVNWGLSPDGRTLAIIDITQPETVIQLWSVSSGEKRELSVAGWPKLETVDWAADGKSMFVATGVSGGKSSLLNVYLDGRVKVLRNENNQLVHWAVPSPDGHRLAIMESSFYSNVWVTGTDK